ncbi:hypothetical protein [Embleya sp. NPDC059237]|uniref:hypothetical protein n=1 Tax=Embleya sp. NPDC059237 TaxID=3346784 RepID=UPI0036C62B69
MPEDTMTGPLSAREAHLRLLMLMSGRVSDDQLDVSWGPMMGGEDDFALTNLIAGLIHEGVPITEHEAELLHIAADGEDIDTDGVEIVPDGPQAAYYTFTPEGPDAPDDLDAAITTWAAGRKDVPWIGRTRRVAPHQDPGDPDTWVYVVRLAPDGNPPVIRGTIKTLMYGTGTDYPVEVFTRRQWLPPYQKAALAAAIELPAT